MMKIRKTQKMTVKGMTLMECIVALFVFGVTAMMMATICTTVSKLLINSNHMNNKRVAEAPVSSVQDVDTLEDGSGNPRVIAGADGNNYTADAKEPVKFFVSSGAMTPVEVQMNRYDTAVLGQASDRNVDTNMEGNLRFYVVDTP